MPRRETGEHHERAAQESAGVRRGKARQRLSPSLLHALESGARREMRERVAGTRLTLGPTTIAAAAVPLFRNGAKGLEQAVRVWVQGIDSPLSAEISVGGRKTDAARLEAREAEQTVMLFVPEVDRKTTANLSVSSKAHGAVSAEITITPQRKWTIHLFHQSHFDYGYTDQQATVLDAAMRYIDAALDLIAETDDWDEDAKFRWNVEVTYPLRHWFETRPRAARDEFVRRVKEGRIEVNALPFSMHTEVYSIDELAWSLEYAQHLREEYGFEIVSAVQSDVPGATIGLLNLLTAAGVRYFSVAHNYAGRSAPYLTGGQELTRPFWWQGADGKRLMVWIADTPHGVAYMEGNLAGIDAGPEKSLEVLPDYLLSLATQPYPYGKGAFGWHDLPPGLAVTKKPDRWDLLHLRVQSSIADNAPPALQISETVRDWNAQWAYPKLIMSTNRTFFESAEQRIGKKINTFTGDWTDWWVDGVGSGAIHLAINRKAQADLPVGQSLDALSDAISGTTEGTPREEIDRTWEAMALFDEHTWGAANPWTNQTTEVNSGALQWARKSGFAVEAGLRSDRILDAAITRFGTLVKPATKGIASLVVFNPSSWERSDLVRVFLPAELVPAGAAFQVVDAVSGAKLPYRLDPQPHPRFRARGQWLTFRADALPPVGYARFDLIAGKAPAGKRAAADPWTMESDAYRLRVDGSTGEIEALVDLQSGRDLIDLNAPFGFNEYVYDTYTSGQRYNHLSGRVHAIDDMNLFGSRSTGGDGVVIHRSSDALAERLTMRLVAEGAEWLETTYTIPHGLKRVDIENRLLKIATEVKESMYFAFPFAVADEDPEYDITGGVTSQDTPHVPGSAQHMFAIRHWVGLQDKAGSAAWVTHDAPLIELGSIALPYLPFPPTTPPDLARRATIYSWPVNNLWDTNFPVQQGGEMVFRYSVSSDPKLGRRELGIRTAATAAQPLTGVVINRRRSGGATLPARGSFCGIDRPDVVVTGVRRSTTGHDLVVMVHSSASERVTARATFSDLDVASVHRGTFLEQDLEALRVQNRRVSLEIHPGEYIALVIDLKK